MLTECVPRSVCNTNEVAMTAFAIQLIHDCCPDFPLGCICRGAGLTTNTHHCTQGVQDRPTVPSKQYDSRGAVAGYIGSRGVDNVCEVPSRNEFFDQLLPKLPLHERVRRDHSYESR